MSKGILITALVFVVVIGGIIGWYSYTIKKMSAQPAAKPTEAVAEKKESIASEIQAKEPELVVLKESPLFEKLSEIKKKQEVEETKKEGIKGIPEVTVKPPEAKPEAIEQKEEPKVEVKAIEPPQIKRNYNTKMIVFDNTAQYKSRKTVPIGTIFDVYLINNIVSNNYASPVITGVIEPLVYNGELILPVGSRLIGSASAGRMRDRAFVEFHTAVYPDGSTVPIGGIGMNGEDGSAGLRGLLVDKRGVKMLAAFAADFMSAFTMMMTDTYINPVTGNQEISTNTKNAVWGGIANSFQKISEDLRTASNRDDAYLVVVAGTAVKVYLTSTVDFEKKGG
jgi:type IV secretory pathway VirB10-like protein